MLPVLAARYGWPAQVIEAYATNRPHASAGDIASAILTDAAFRAPSTALATAQQATGATVHTYEFAWRTPVGNLGACHALELGFVFDTLGEGNTMAGQTAPQQLADEIHRAWVAFARDGDPGWTAWTPDNPAVMTFALASEVVTGPRADELSLWPTG